MLERFFSKFSGRNTGIKYTAKYKEEFYPYYEIKSEQESAKILAEAKGDPEGYALRELKENGIHTLLPKVIVTEFGPGEVMHEGTEIIGEIRTVWNFEEEMRLKLASQQGFDAQFWTMALLLLLWITVPFIIYFIILASI